MFRNIDKTGLTYELDDETSWTRVMVCRFGIYIIINDRSCHSYSDNTQARNTCKWLPSNNIVVIWLWSHITTTYVFICWIKSISLCSDTRLYLGERNSMICIIKNLLTLIRVCPEGWFLQACVSKWCPDILLANTVIQGTAWRINLRGHKPTSKSLKSTCHCWYRWTWIWQTQWDQAYRPSCAKIHRTVFRHIQVHLYTNTWYINQQRYRAMKLECSPEISLSRNVNITGLTKS